MELDDCYHGLDGKPKMPPAHHAGSVNSGRICSQDPPGFREELPVGRDAAPETEGGHEGDTGDEHERLRKVVPRIHQHTEQQPQHPRRLERRVADPDHQPLPPRIMPQIPGNTHGSQVSPHLRHHKTEEQHCRLQNGVGLGIHADTECKAAQAHGRQQGSDQSAIPCAENVKGIPVEDHQQDRRRRRQPIQHRQRSRLGVALVLSLLTNRAENTGLLQKALVHRERGERSGGQGAKDTRDCERGVGRPRG
mmetsp:Transcript_19218/g.48811  ORF Transcript_19218/g.48811 Transcript_19218/m.48811 type:complete len:250 (-) Transcript_19218:1584-2333(-)